MNVKDHIPYVALFLFWTLPFQLAYAESMINVPAGPFPMGKLEELPVSPTRVLVPDFWIDPFEVSNAEFSAIFPDHGYPAGADRHPVSHVTWEEAKRYCERLNKRLPTTPEWEKAARGTDARMYPRGNKKLRKKAHPSYSGMVKRSIGVWRPVHGCFGLGMDCGGY